MRELSARWLNQREPHRPAPAHSVARAGLPAWAITATTILATAAIIIAITAALTRGPWMDEFWTLWAADPTVPWREAWTQRWLTDVHPPTFYMVSRLLAGLLGEDVAMRRLQNLIPLAGLIGFFLYAGSAWKQARSFLLVYAVLTFSSYFMTGYFAEYRSYFAQFCCGIVFYACAYALLCGDRMLAARDRPIAIGLLLAMSTLLINLHFITTVATLMSLGGLALLALIQRQRALFVMFCTVAVLATIPLAVILFFQAPYLLAKSGGHFWIETGVGAAMLIVVGSIAKGVGCNLVVAGVAGLSLLPPGRGGFAFLARREQGDFNGNAAADRLIGGGFLAIAAVSLCVFLAINLKTPIIIDRYLVLCSAAVGCGLAILASDSVFRLRGGFLFLLANAVLFLGVAGGKLIFEPRWNASAALLGERVAACPTTKIEAFQFPYPDSLPNEVKALDLAYTYLGERFGFHAQAVGAGRPIDPVPGQGCPTLLWTEHVMWSRAPRAGPDALIRDTAQQVIGPIDLRGATVQRTYTGAIITLGGSPQR